MVLNIADMRTRHSREAFASLREHFGDKLIETTIRSSIAYAESAERALSILDYRPDLAVDYLDVADELLTRLDRERRAQAAAQAAPASSRPRPPAAADPGLRRLNLHLTLAGETGGVTTESCGGDQRARAPPPCWCWGSWACSRSR